MRQKREPNFQVEVAYKEVQDKRERLQKLWDLLLALPDPEEEKENHEHHEGLYNIQNTR